MFSFGLSILQLIRLGGYIRYLRSILFFRTLDPRGSIPSFLVRFETSRLETPAPKTRTDTRTVLTFDVWLQSPWVERAPKISRISPKQLVSRMILLLKNEWGESVCGFDY